jgi:ribosome-binding factor A
MRHKKSTPNRSFRVADQIQRDLAELIRELKDPRMGMVTLNSGRGLARLCARQGLLLGAAGRREETTTALNEAAGFLRNGLFKRLSIHTVPTLHFHYDRTTERAADLSALIARPTPPGPRTTDEGEGRGEGEAAGDTRHPPSPQRRSARAARRAAARQAPGLDEPRRAAKAKGCCVREGRPHRHAGPAGHRVAAAVLRCGHQVQPGQPGRRQALPRHAASWANARAPATARAKSSTSARWRSTAPPWRPPVRASPAHRPVAADAFGAEAPGQGAV